MTFDPRMMRPESRMMSHGYDPFLSEGAAKPPIFMTSTFVFKTAEEGEQYFKWAYGLEERRADQTMGLIYSRLNNPGLQILEERLALWDRSELALSFASGMAAITAAVLTYVKPGDVVLYSMPVYGGTEFLFEKILPKFGVTAQAFSAGIATVDLEILAREAGANLALIYLETPANPTNLMIDIAEVAGVASRVSSSDRRVLTFVDNTFLGPIFQDPLSLGADACLYSATKYIGGHSDVIAGAVTGSREVVGPMATYRTIMGSMPDPFGCWLLMRSLETLKLRMEAQAQTAGAIARALEAHPQIERVYYPGTLDPASAQYAIYRKQCSGPGAIVTFEIRGGKPAAFRFLNAVKLCKLAVSLGGTESLVEHPASMTHADIPREVQDLHGITESMVRLSVGVENVDDLLGDLRQALEVASHDPVANEVAFGGGI